MLVYGHHKLIVVSHEDVRQCNTTLSLAVFINGDIYYGHVGDSGIFAFYDDGNIEPITTQQNVLVDVLRFLSLFCYSFKTIIYMLCKIEGGEINNVYSW